MNKMNDVFAFQNHIVYFELYAPHQNKITLTMCRYMCSYITNVTADNFNFHMNALLFEYYSNQFIINKIIINLTDLTLISF